MGQHTATKAGRAMYFARLQSLGIDHYEIVRPMCAALDKPHPLDMDPDRRARMLQWLAIQWQTRGGRIRVLQLVSDGWAIAYPDCQPQRRAA